MTVVDQNSMIPSRRPVDGVNVAIGPATPDLDSLTETLLSTSNRSFPILEEDMTSNESATGNAYGSDHEHQEMIHQSVAGGPNALLMQRTMANSGASFGVVQQVYGSDHESDYTAEAEEEADRVFPHLPAFEQQFPGSHGIPIKASHGFSPRTPVNTPLVLTTRHTPSQSYSQSHMSSASRRARSGSQSAEPIFELERAFEHSLQLDAKLACLFSPREHLTDAFSLHNVLSFSPPPPPPPSPTLGFKRGSARNFMESLESLENMESMSFSGQGGRNRLDLGIVGQSAGGN